MEKPSVKITWFGTEPTVETEGEVDVELIDGDAEAEHYFTHGEVSIYHTTKDGEVLSDYWLAVYPRVDWQSDIAFDVRELPGIPEQLEEKYGNLYPEEDIFQVLAYCIDADLIPQASF